MNEKDFKEERRLFEIWYKKQFSKSPDLLKHKNTDGSYKEMIITTLFGGFIGGVEMHKLLSEN